MQTQPDTGLFLSVRRQFHDLVEPHRPNLWRYCLRLTGSAWDAEDLTQDTMLKAFGQLHMIAGAHSPRAYLFRIASNAWIDTVRRARPAGELDDALDAPAPPSADPVEASAALSVVVSALPPRQRVVFLLVDAFDFRLNEVATMLRISEGAVKALLHRARAALRQAPPKPADATARQRAEHKTLIEKYADALNRRDADALVALFDPIAVNELVGGGELTGADALRMVVARWGADPRAPWVEFGEVDGRDAALVFVATVHGARTLTAVVNFIVEDGRILAQRWYQFTPELLQHAAARLGVPAENHGYGVM